MSDAPDLTPRRFPADDGAATSYVVLEGGSAGDPSVILMHEVVGVNESLLTLVGQLIAAGYRVHVPVLYGDREVTGLVRGGWRAICMRRELGIFALGQDSPLADWLRTLVVDVAATTQRPVGVIGMCMTGGLAIAAMAEPQTGAAVAAQPFPPVKIIKRRAARMDLGCSPDTLEDAVANGTPLLTARYDRDMEWRCPAARIDTVREMFGNDEPVQPITRPDGVTVEQHDQLRIIALPGRGHSVFTDDPDEGMVELLIGFLNNHL